MKTHENNKILSQPKTLRITLDKSVPVKDERPIARLYQLFSCFNKQWERSIKKMNEIFFHALIEFVIAPLALLKAYLLQKENKDLKRRLGK